MIYFGADFHFNDTNILKYQYERKIYGNNISSINNNLIMRQNAQVTNNDTVYIIGDFVCGNSINEVMKIVARLNGNIILLLGNHDDMFNDKHGTITNKFTIRHGIQNVTIFNRYNIYMYHYPLLEQPDYHLNNSYHLYGHVHGDRSHPSNKAIDVGCNLHDYRLLSENKIIDLLSNI